MFINEILLNTELMLFGKRHVKLDIAERNQ